MGVIEFLSNFTMALETAVYIGHLTVCGRVFCGACLAADWKRMSVGHRSAEVWKTARRSGAVQGMAGWYWDKTVAAATLQHWSQGTQTTAADAGGDYKSIVMVTADPNTVVVVLVWKQVKRNGRFCTVI